MPNNLFIMKRNTFFSFFLALAVLGSVSKIYAADFDTAYVSKPFVKTAIKFLPNEYKGVWRGEDGLIRIANGRIILKKVHIPKFKRDVRVSATVRLTSAGDPWDKSGSCFIIPASSDINMLSVAMGEKEYLPVDSVRYGHLVGAVLAEEYQPAIEIMRFMTPFGVGHFSRNDSIGHLRMPVYIDGWAPYVEWQDDVTQLYSALTGDVYVGMYVDTWTAKGYEASLTLTVRESQLRSDKCPRRYVIPLLNTIPYYKQTYPTLFSSHGLDVSFDLPSKSRHAMLYYIVTGHGGHNGGDEFTKQENHLSIDGRLVLNYTPWRTDCAQFRRFNPTSGVWLQKRMANFISEKGKRGHKEIEETIASSDLSRSNWCPGSMVAPYRLPLDLTPGTHHLTVDIPHAQPAEGDKMNHWLVSAYIVFEK